MSSWSEKAKQKRRNRNRIVTLVLIYVMIIGLLAGVTMGNGAFGDNANGYIIASIVLGVFTILYWVIFLILIRRSNQRGDK